MIDKSHNADIRELQTDIKYLVEKVDKIDEKVTFTNGKISRAIIDIANLQEQKASKDELAKHILNTSRSKNAHWDKLKWIVIGAIVSALVTFFSIK